MKGRKQLMAVEGLTVTFLRDGMSLPVVRRLDLDIFEGECVALVGESGCGKSVSCLALTRLPPTDAARCEGAVWFDGQDLRRIGRRSMRSVRRGGIAYVFQDPSGSLDPVTRIRTHLKECMPGGASSRKAMCLSLEKVGLPERCLEAYPVELSGGQQQRVTIAMATASSPRLLVTDEPTTALDVRTQHEVLRLIGSLCRETGAGWLLVTHNLGIAAERADRLYVMYAGGIVESGPTRDLLRLPRHPYTRGLLDAVPRLTGPRRPPNDIPGNVPAPDAIPEGCAFAPRCVRAEARCRAEAPPLVTPVAGYTLRCHYPMG